MTEQEIQVAVCDYVRLKYPEVIFNSDLAGNNASPYQAGINTQLRSSSGYPDWFAASPQGKYHGLFLELKREGVKLHKRDGSWASDHIAKQAEVLTKLDQAGYYAYFAIGFTEAVEILEEYFTLPSSEETA